MKFFSKDPNTYVENMDWLNAPPHADGTPLEDDEIPIPFESPTVTMFRDDISGPYMFTDSTDWVHPDTLAVFDPKEVGRIADEHNATRREEGIPANSVDIPRAQREWLEQLSAEGDLTAAMLLRTLNRGMETTTAKIDEALDKKLRRANSLLRFFVKV